MEAAGGSDVAEILDVNVDVAAVDLDQWAFHQKMLVDGLVVTR